MTLMQTTSPTTYPEIQSFSETLSGLMREQVKYLEQVVALVKGRLIAQDDGDLAAAQHCIDLEKEALTNFVLVERERIATLRQIGLALSHRNPSGLRVAELIFYVSPELRDELLDSRESLRDAADELEQLRAMSSHFRHQAAGRVTLFLSHDVPEARTRQWILDHFDAPLSSDLGVPYRPRGQAEPHFSEDF